MTDATRPDLPLLRWLIAPLLLLALAACATPFKADVSRFESKLPPPDGVTFAVVPDNPERVGSLEFAEYARLVEAKMVEIGYRPAEPEEATLLVRFDYSVDKGREKIRTTGFYDPFYDPFWDPWYRGYYYPRSRYYRHRLWRYGFYDPWLVAPEVTSYTVYTSQIVLKIDDRETGERLFEGKAQAVSTTNRLQYLVPNLVEAMFTDFPGNSGETVRITIKPEGKKVKKVKAARD